MRLKLFLLFVALASIGSIRAQQLRTCVDKKGRVGFADQSGREVIKCQYESAQPFKNGIAIVSKSGKFGLIDVQGNAVQPIRYSQIMPWTSNMYLVKDGKKMGLADASGKIVLDVKYSLITSPNCYGKALIAIGGKLTTNDNKKYMANAKYGIVDNSGNILVSPIHKGLYEFILEGNDAFYEGKRLGYSYHYITDTLVTDCKFLGFSKNGFNIYKSGLIDGKGNELIKAGLYDYIMQPQNGMVRYYITKKKETVCGYHNLTSDNILQVASFNKAFSDLTAPVHGDFSEDIAPVKYGTSWTFINKTGTTLRQGYKQIKYCKNFGVWAAKTLNEKWDVFDGKNNDIQALSGYDDILFPMDNSDKGVYVVKKDGAYGAINRDGAILIPFDYSQACASSANYVAVQKNGYWGLLTAENHVVIPFEYKGLILPIEKNSRHFWVQKSDSQYYHYSVDGNVVSKTGFKSVSNFEDGLAFVIPASLVVENSTVNRAQLFLPNTAQEKVATVDISQFKSTFGYLINTEDVIVTSRPISRVYLDTIRKKVGQKGNRRLSESETKNLLLDITRDNRSYGLDAVIKEDDWDY